MSADLVWSRYNAMAVADTVLISFLGSSNTDPLLIPGAIAGIVVTVLWWLLTSYGWSLLHAEGVPQKYVDWRSKFPFEQDPIWWSAHAVIWFYYFAYGGLLWFYLDKKAPTCAVAGTVAAVAIVFVVLLSYTLIKLRIRRFEWIRE